MKKMERYVLKDEKGELIFGYVNKERLRTAKREAQRIANDKKIKVHVFDPKIDKPRAVIEPKA